MTSVAGPIEQSSRDVQEGNEESCPYHIQNDTNLSNLIPNNLSNASLNHPNKNLSTERIISSIPKSSTEENWSYPSPSMFYIAMQKKGHDPEATQMPLIVNIHNIVNEQTWQQIRRWELYFNGQNDIKLARFMGKPDKLSPKARFRSFFGYKRPFDRHDWWIDRSDGTSQRYVIDFYNGNSLNKDENNSIHIDARPALDDLIGWKMRIIAWTKSLFLG